MEYTTLGRTGMEVSRICLGCGNFGDPDWRDWILDETESLAILERAIDLGITYFDTANKYSLGESERILGTAIEGRRRDLTVATKGFFRVDGPDPSVGSLARNALQTQLTNSLDRLNVDTVDLYQIHRYDPKTPWPQLLRTLDDAVGRGQIRHVGASSMWAHQFAESLHTSDRMGYERFLTMQNHYNLLYREEEREMLPLCDREDVAVVPWGPLARGYLTRPPDQVTQTVRGSADSFAKTAPYLDGGGKVVTERVQELAEQKDLTMAQMALAWILHKDVVTAPIVGVESIEQLEQAVDALSVSLTESEVEYLEEPYESVQISGHE